MPFRRTKPRRPKSPRLPHGLITRKGKPLPGPIIPPPDVEPRLKLTRKEKISRIKGDLAAFLRQLDALPKLTFDAIPRPNCLADWFPAGRALVEGPRLGNIPAHLQAAFAAGQEANEADARYQWTHILSIPKSVPIKDPFPNPPGIGPYPPSGEGPRVYIAPKLDAQGRGPWLQGGPIFYVVLVERLHRGTGREYKRVYLRRARGVEK